MNIVNGWLLCDVSVAERQLADLGIEQDGNIWQPFAVKLSEVVTMEPFVDNNGEEDGTAIYLKNGENFIINVPFRNFMEKITLEDWTL